VIKHIYLLLFGVCISISVYSQDVDVDLDALARAGNSAGHRASLDPQTLAASLLKGKGSDKEKFDALFGWVAMNLQYDYRAFYSTGAVSSDDMQPILKNRKAICLGYANLMDTLCKEAGLPSVVVTGYATDDLFDVNDSIFGCNHAWNAVKLDGYWYLYDVTWSSGKTTIELKPWARYVERWLNTFQVKYKKKRLGRRYDRLLRTQCDDVVKRSKTYYFKQRFFNRLLVHWLRHVRLPLYGQRVYHQRVTADYYLSDPAVFSLTHFPDDPTWNLGSGKSIEAMQADSGYYYLNDSILENQNHTGRECPDCDAYTGLSEKEQLHWKLSHSKAFNAKNHYATTGNHYQLAMLHWEERAGARDTAEFRRSGDSIARHLDALQAEISDCRISEKLSFNQQKRKSLRKQRLLLDENKQHRGFVKAKVKATQQELRSFRELENKALAFVDGYKHSAHQVHQIRTNIKVPERASVAAQKIARIEKRLGLREARLDSMAEQIDAYRARFDTLVNRLALNVWQQRYVYDSLHAPIALGTQLRYRGQDNYKKIIADLRRHLVFHERNFEAVVQQQIFDPADSCARLFNQVAYLVKWKNAFQKECLGYKRELIKANAMGTDELARYKDEVLKDRRKDRCWLYAMYPKIYASERGFDFMVFHQYELLGVIDAENAAERARHSKIVMPELKRRFKKHMSMNVHNQRLTKRLLRKLKHEAMVR